MLVRAKGKGLVAGYLERGDLIVMWQQLGEIVHVGKRIVIIQFSDRVIQYRLPISAQFMRKPIIT